MSEKGIETVAIIGAGTMGGGIAAVCLVNGYAVNLFDPSREALKRAARRIEKSVARSVATVPEAGGDNGSGRSAAAGSAGEAGGAAGRGRVVAPEQDGTEGALERFDIHYQLEAAVETSDIVIEAVPEKLDLKRDIFAQLDRSAPAHAVLASNTSELSITAIAGATRRPEKVVGMHWFNPPERMRLIELVRGVHTDEETLAAVRAMAERCDKTTVLVEDRQGFVTTRALAALLTEAMRMLEEGVASRSDIDTAVKLGLNHPMGPLELADYVGLDTMLFISESMTEAMGERFRAPQLLRRMVEAGRLGRKTGAGFFDYPEGQ